ncbi:MAG TPA: hypothetical protein QF813_00915 [Alphaproteobacteria bacterium]|jgi:hypothetical protein|nr:hypothetical protein [Alphaproteobacteria bacterium]
MKHAVGRCALATLVGKIDIVTYRGEVKGWRRRIAHAAEMFLARHPRFAALCGRFDVMLVEP